MGSLDTMSFRVRALVEEVCADRGVDPLKIVGRCRVQKVFRARTEIARRLNASGYSTVRIGMILNCDHSTIVFYLGRGKKKPSTPIWRAPVVKHVRFIKQRKPPRPKQIKFYLQPYAGADMTEYHWQERPSITHEEHPI